MISDALGSKQESYFRTELLYSLICLLVSENSKAATSQNDSRIKLSVAMLPSFAHAEALKANPLQPHTLLGLGKDKLKNSTRDAYRTLQKHSRSLFLPRLEQLLLSKCIDICTFLHCPESLAVEPTDSFMRMPQIIQVPALIHELREKIASAQERIHSIRKKYQILLDNRLRIQKQLIHVYTDIFHEFKEDDPQLYIHRKTRWLSTAAIRLDLLSARATYKIAKEMYGHRQTCVLTAISESLEARRSKAIKKRRELQEQLQVYHQADAVWQAIIKEYRATRTSISEKESWMRSLKTVK